MHEIHLHRLDLNLLVTFEALMDGRSVTLAAAQLGKSPSAVSHALGRLREQVGDPLMVKVGNTMVPSPFALTLIEDVRPILRSIVKVVAPPRQFDPATSERVFRLAIPAFAPLMTRVVERVLVEAPGVLLEWYHPTSDTLAAVVDGRVDISQLGGTTALPEGLEARPTAPFQWLTFARKDHPALQDWGLEAWLRWPHIQVRMSNTVPSPITTKLAETGRVRRIGATIPDFSSAAPLLATSDLLGTFTPLLMAEEMERYGLRVLQPPIDLPPFANRFFWSARLTNDSGNRWIRRVVIDCYADLQRSADAQIEAAIMVMPQSGR